MGNARHVLNTKKVLVYGKNAVHRNEDSKLAALFRYEDAAPMDEDACGNLVREGSEPWKEMRRLADEHVRTRPKVERSSFIGVIILFVRNATDGPRSPDLTDSPYPPGLDFVCHLSNPLWAKDRLTALWNRRDLVSVDIFLQHECLSAW